MNQKKLKYMDAFKHENILGDRNEIKDVTTSDKLDLTNVDTYLRYPQMFCRDKVNDVPNCDNLVITNVPRQRDLNTGCYWITPNKTFGRGFGDLDVKNNLWYSYDTRLMDAENASSIELYDYKFHAMHRNVQDPNFLVSDIPRGGYDTRHINKC
jgi:hypothetical protein